jgi:hypothetical protein
MWSVATWSLIVANFYCSIGDRTKKGTMPRKKATRNRYTDGQKKQILAAAKKEGLTGARVKKLPTALRFARHSRSAERSSDRRGRHYFFRLRLARKREQTNARCLDSASNWP